MDRKKNVEAKPINYVHQQIIHTGNIKQELKYESKNKKYDYSFNPYRCKFRLIYISLSFN